MDSCFRRRIVSLAAIALLGFCGNASAQVSLSQRSVVRDPSFRIAKPVKSWREIKTTGIVMQQRDYSCGAAALATLLRFYWSDAVVTFGSTIALEACWMGKPSFILGPSYYDQLDVSYTPQSVEELIKQLNGELHPGNAENAAKFAVFAVTEGDDYQYITMETGKMKPQGFRQRNMVLTRLARYFDNIACNVIKSTLSRKNANHRKAA